MSGRGVDSDNMASEEADVSGWSAASLACS